ncbi:hypothetical protein ACH36K_01500 [Clostridium sp. MB05]
MKGKMSIIASLMMVLLLVGCGNSIIKKSIEQAKVAIENKEYAKALISLELALDEDKDNKEAKNLYSIVEGYQQAKKLVDENKIDEAKKIVDDIDSGYSNYAIKEDIDKLKSQIDSHLKEVENVSLVLSEAESLFNNKKYAECKVYLYNNILGSKGDSIEPNKYATEEQKAKAEELAKSSEEAIAEIEANRIAEESKKQEEARKVEEEKSKQNTNNFTKEQAISYVVKIYGNAEAGHEYRISSNMKNNGKNYYEVYYGVKNSPNSPGADYYGYYVYEDGTVKKFLDNLN